jgi:adenylosuccinate lyase
MESKSQMMMMTQMQTSMFS